MRVNDFVFQIYTLFVFVKESGVISVCLALAVVAIELVESLFVGSTFRVGKSQSPLAEASGGVAGVLHHPPDGHGVCLERILSFQFFVDKHGIVVIGGTAIGHFVVVAYLCVSRMHAGHQDTPRRGRYRRTGVVLGEAHSFLPELVDMGGLYFFLSIAAYVTES